MGRINLRNTVVTFEDDAGNSITFGPGPGDLNVTNLVAYANEEAVEATNRGEHDGFVTGPPLRQEWSLTLELDKAKWTDATISDIKDWFRRKGKFDPSTGSQPLTSVDDCSWAWKIKAENTVCGATGGFILPKCRGKGDFAESDTASTLSCSGMNYVQPEFF